MHCMILAAGRGLRMRPLTDACPKPLLKVGGKPLIVWRLEQLARAGFCEIVINHAHLGGMIEDALGDGARFGVRITYSAEPAGALETAGGIRLALPLLSDPFLTVNGDIWCDWDCAQALDWSGGDDLAHLVLVDNPPQHPQGDFSFRKGRLYEIAADADTAIASATDVAVKLTFSGIGIYRHALFADLPPGAPAKLAPLLRAAIAENRVSGEHHRGRWEDVGTIQRLNALRREFDADSASA